MMAPERVNIQGVNTNEVVGFFNSMRGQYIIGQALFRAIKIMETEEYPEHSNLRDMKYLMEYAFPIFNQCSEKPIEFDEEEE